MYVRSSTRTHHTYAAAHVHITRTQQHTYTSHVHITHTHHMYTTDVRSRRMQQMYAADVHSRRTQQYTYKTHTGVTAVCSVVIFSTSDTSFSCGTFACAPDLAVCSEIEISVFTRQPQQNYSSHVILSS